jgi:hypothetical protein
MPKKESNDYVRWLDKASAIERTDNPLKVPYDVFLKEAGQVAGFVSAYWEPADGRPGLKRVKARLPKTAGDDIVSQVRAVQEAQTRLLLLVDPIVINYGDRARQLIDELESPIEFLLDDGVEEPADAQLLAVQEFHAQNGQRSSALHQSLSAYAALAESLEDRLVEVDDAFDVKLIAEAKGLARKLTEAAAVPAPAASEVAAATKIRNQLLVLLTASVGRARKAVAHVFKDHPNLVREVTSTYERRRRATARRAKAEAEAKAKEGSTSGEPE